MIGAISIPPARITLFLKAHQTNNRAVMKAYGIPIRETDEAACVADEAGEGGGDVTTVISTVDEE